MKMYASPSPACRLSKKVDDLGLHGDVERGDGLVADDHLRVQRQPTRNPDALALTAGELVRVPVDVLGVEPHQVQQLLNALPAVAFGKDVSVDFERLANDISDCFTRIQRRIRILKDDLDVPSQPAHRGTLLGVDVDPVEGELAGGWFLQPHQHPAKGRFAAAGLPDDAERLALVELEGDPVDRLDVADRPPQHAGLDRVVLDQVLGLEDDLAASCATSPVRARSSAS